MAIENIVFNLVFIYLMTRSRRVAILRLKETPLNFLELVARARQSIWSACQKQHYIKKTLRMWNMFQVKASKIRLHIYKMAKYSYFLMLYTSGIVFLESTKYWYFIIQYVPRSWRYFLFPSCHRYFNISVLIFVAAPPRYIVPGSTKKRPKKIPRAPRVNPFKIKVVKMSIQIDEILRKLSV